MDSKPKLPSSSREMRNIAEKMRRDKLNNYVSELASIVPLVCGSSKRIDKTSVLRLAANYIRMHNILGDAEDETIDTTPRPIHKGVMNSIQEAIGGFLLVVTSLGKVVFITEAVESFFGYTQVDLLGNSIYNVIHPEDHDILKEQLNSKDESRRSFFCRMMEKALSRNDPSRYEIIHIVGTLKALPEPLHSTGVTPSTPKEPDESVDSNYSDSDEDEVRSVHHPSNRIGTHMLVSFVRVVKDRPITELSLVESTQDEYITRHTMDGKILYTDHRISFVTGLMPTEVLGTSAFKYMHSEDMVWSMVAHKLMFTSTQGQGLVSYRLKCKGGTMVTLRSRGYIELNKQTGQAETFVCINTVVSNKEAKNEIKNQRRKLLPMIVCPQSEDHLGSVSSSMPPELLSVMKQLMDPRTIRKMIAEVDPTFNLAAAFGTRVAEQAEIFKNLDPENSMETILPDDVHQDKDKKYSGQEDTGLVKSYEKPQSDEMKEKRASNISRKRNSSDQLCTLPTKIPNQENMSRHIADVYHHSYSPQDSVPLPNLSPDTVQPLLSPSPSTLPQEMLNFSQPSKYLESNNIHMPGEGHSKAGTNSMHSQHQCKLEGNEFCSNQHPHSLLNDNYQDCRQCNKKCFDSSRYSMDQSQRYELNRAGDAGSCHQSTRSPTDPYQCQNTPENASASKYPSTFCNQDQMHPQYLGSTNGLDQESRNFHMPSHQFMSYTHGYTNSYQANHSYCSSVPEFDIKLQRQHQQQDRSHFIQSPQLPHQSHCLSQQRFHAQQDWASNSTIPQSYVMGANPMAASAQATYNIPNQSTTSPIDNQGPVRNMHGSSSVPVVYEKCVYHHQYGAKFSKAIADSYSDQHF